MAQITGKMSRADLAAIGDINAEIANLRRFRCTVRALHRDHDELVARYPGKWVGYADERLVAVGDSLDDILRVIEERGIPRESFYAQFLEPDAPDLAV